MTAWSGWLVGLTLLATPAVSVAQQPAPSPDAPIPSAADALYRAGLQSLQEGDLAAACAKLGESHRLEPATGAALALGLCLERQEKLAEAVLAYEDAARLARANDDEERAAAAGARADELRPRVPRVVALPPSPPSSPQEPTPPLRAVSPAPDRGEEETTVSAMTVAGAAVGGLGLVAWGVGAAFGLAGAGDAAALEELGYDEAAGTCRRDLSRCQDLYRSADSSGTVSMVAWSAGAALLATGVVLIVVGAAEAAGPSVALATNGGGATLTARYAP